MGTLNPDAYSPMSGRLIDEDGNVQNVVDLLGASTPVSTATLNPDAYSPTSGRFIGENGETHNIVDMLGGSNAVSAERLNINAYSPMSGRFIGEDGKVYNLVDMIRDNQSSLTEAINVLNGTEGTYTPSEMASAILDAIPTETANGNPIHITDAANYPAESVVTILEPVQDLHGFDKPWVGGTGKNKLPLPTAETKNGYTLTHNADGSVTVKGSGNATTYFDFFDGTFDSTQYAGYVFTSGFSASVTGVMFRISGSDRASIQQTTTTMTISDNGNGLYFAIRIAENTDLSSGVTIYPMLRASIETDEFTPYSNICSISGWSEVGVWRSGVNVWDEEWEVGSYNSSTGEKMYDPNKVRAKNPISILPNTVYYFISSASAPAYYYDAGNNFILSENIIANRTFTTPENAYYMTFNFYNAYGTTYKHDVSINYPSTDHDYHPGTVASVEVQLDQTVYGGTVDVVSGVLTVDRAMVDLGTLNYYYQSNNNRFTSVTQIENAKYAPNDNTAWDAVCSALPSVSANQTTGAGVTTYGIAIGSSDSTLRIRYEGITDATEFKTAMSGVQLCYELATPIEIPLTPEIITLLKGDNNIWTDSGTSEIEYKVDLQTYINKLINAQNNVSKSANRGMENIEPLLNTEEVDNVITDNDTEEEEVRVSE